MYLKARYVLDRILAAAALLVLSPLLLVVAVLVARDGGPVLFRQARLGRGAEEFEILKFRSMIVDADRYLDATGMPTCDRITPVGRILRKTSIDELPQFINIVRGDMALIGPRAILPEFLPHITDREKRRFRVLPGLSGWAQVNGRNSIKWSRRFELDNDYIDRAGPRIDLRIVYLTIVGVLMSKEISMDRNAAQVNDITIRPVVPSEQDKGIGIPPH